MAKKQVEQDVDLTKELEVTEEKMDVAIQNFSKALMTLRAGRANPHVLDKISIDYYGSVTPLTQIANIAAPEARLITIQPFDPTQIKAIEKAILSADLGFNPSNDGKVIRLAVPQLTEETRKELVKKAKKFAEECKVSIRNVRRKEVADLKDFEKDSSITEDDLKQAEKDIQKLTDKKIKEIDSIMKQKEEEILEV